MFLEKELMAVFQILNYVHHPKQVKKYQLECRDRKLTPPPLPPLILGNRNPFSVHRFAFSIHVSGIIHYVVLCD